MINLSEIVVVSTATIRQAMEAIDRGSHQIACVIDNDQRLVAIVTDGDIRRGLLRGLRMDSPVEEVMQTRFTAVTEAQGRSVALDLMKARRLHQVPIVDNAGRLVDLALVDQVRGLVSHDTRVVLMAGGLGTRLRPLTETMPKPMLPVGGRPILELILHNFAEQGFHEFTISLNYKGEMIREHFGDGSRFNVRIDYVEETKWMGTAGALSLLETRPDSPFIVMNGDLLTAVPFDSLARFHRECSAVGTMCARDYPMQVPYGVIEVEDGELLRIVEKPTYSHFVNAGIYMLSPEALEHVVADEFLDMPTLFERIIASGQKAFVFPIQEYWVDIGRPDDLQKARSDFSKMFRGNKGAE